MFQYTIQDEWDDDVKEAFEFKNMMLRKTPEELERYVNSSFFNYYICGYCTLFMQYARFSEEEIVRAINVSSGVLDFIGAKEARENLKKIMGY